MCTLPKAMYRAEQIEWALTETGDGSLLIGKADHRLMSK